MKEPKTMKTSSATSNETAQKIRMLENEIARLRKLISVSPNYKLDRSAKNAPACICEAERRFHRERTWGG